MLQFILALCMIFVCFSACLVLNYCKDYVAKIKLKRFNERHGFTAAYLAHLADFQYAHIKRWAEMLQKSDANSQTSA